MKTASLVILAASVISFAFGQSAPVLPQDAVALQKSYLDARQRALDPVERKYRTELEKLMAAHTKAGRIDAALAIRREIDQMKADEPDRVQSKRQLSEWLLTISADHIASGGHGKFLTTFTRRKAVVLKEKTGKIDEYDFTIDLPRTVTFFNLKFTFSEDLKTFESLRTDTLVKVPGTVTIKTDAPK